MNPVIQLERTGCGIASVATIVGISYQDAKREAASRGIFASDKALWSKTTHVRLLLDHFGIAAHPVEVPFSAWEALPDLALLSIKWHLRKGIPFWHWVVFVRDGGKGMVLDPKKGLRHNVRTDFGRIRPKWFIPVALGRSEGFQKSL